MKTIVILFALLVFISESRTTFGVTFPKNSNLPVTEADAQKQKWIKIEDSCEGVKYISPKKDLSTIVVFDKSGKLAGVDVGIVHLPSEPMKSRYFTEKTFEGQTYWALQSYFVDPNSICGNRTAGPYGDRVWWKSRVHDDGYFKLPLTQAEAENDPKWVLGTCIWGMGIHYWYDISKDMDCNNFTPFFVMYNNKQLTTFAVGFARERLLEGPDSRFEHAPKFVIRRNFKPETLPQCLMKDEVKMSNYRFNDASLEEIFH